MRLAILAATAALATGVRGANVLITNDDGFGTANIRELYHAMRALGHNCYIVASSTDQSAQGGRIVFTNNAKLTDDAEFGIVKKGAPSIGTDPADDHIWYYNGSPAVQVLVALDYVLPTFANFSTPDLVLAGPNYGLNDGPFLYTMSGTMGATYTAVGRGIPAMAFAAVYGTHTPYYRTNASTTAGLQDPATITGRLAANLAQAFIDKAAARNKDNNSGGGRILPLGYGVSVNIPFITSFTDATCVNPPFVRARINGGGAFTSSAVYDRAKKTFGPANHVDDGVTTCVNGDCSLPSEAEVLNAGCQSSVVLFTNDYDAPYAGGHNSGSLADPYSALLPDLVQPHNATELVGGLGRNASVQGTTAGGASVAALSSSSSSSSKQSNGSQRSQAPSVLLWLVSVAGVAVCLT
ncbi:acid phosphatase [Niveomyces insectorum RCEF 264]|uniref:Acid phosphatase n=1 Tax=Niveomyces insectorum RCEF 264 TaxID=1081102 RepID=A0A167Y491_9HYPO|nr:acid phosphatase [Niveomyces insectorum RCEF 264]